MTGMLFKKLIVLFFLATVFGAGATTWINLKPETIAKVNTESTQGQGINRHYLWSGELARNFEQRYDSDFSLRQIGLNVWAAFQYSLFREAKKGLLIGDHGWLFSSEEFIAYPNGELALENNIEFIAETSRQLASRDVALMVVLIPSKARLLETQTGRHQPAPLQQKVYPQVLNSLQAEPILLVDGLQVMSSHPQPESLYLKTDTHWTPEAAQLVASSAATLLEQRMPELDLMPERFITESAGSQSIDGDLLRFLPLAPLFDNLMPAAETIDLFQTYAPGDELFAETAFERQGMPKEQDLFSSIELPEVVLLGTSFSADRRWNFDGALKQAFAVDIQNLAEQGQGPIAPMARFLSDYLPGHLPDHLPNQLQESDNLKLVIWEIPERYLSVAYSQSTKF